VSHAKNTVVPIRRKVYALSTSKNVYHLRLDGANGAVVSTSSYSADNAATGVNSSADLSRIYATESFVIVTRLADEVRRDQVMQRGRRDTVFLKPEVSERRIVYRRWNLGVCML